MTDILSTPEGKLSWKVTSELEAVKNVDVTNDHQAQEKNCNEGQESDTPILALTKYANHEITLGEEDCSAMLDTLESCVACAEGANFQTQYEERIEGAMYQKSRRAVEPHGLSEKEAALIRFQILGEKKKRLNRGQKKSRSKNEIINSLIFKGNQYMCGVDSTSLTQCNCNMSPEINKNSKNSIPFVTSQTATKDKRYSAPITCFRDQRQDQEASKLPLSENPDLSRDDDNNTGGTDTCSVCFNQFTLKSFAHLPCCGTQRGENRSSIQVCSTCILLLCTPTSDRDARVGRCPRCRAWITVTVHEKPMLKTMKTAAEEYSSDFNQVSGHSDNFSAITVIQNKIVGQCSICNQVKDHLVDNGICDSCYLGQRCPLLYECEQCTNSQLIPHPMYRYQPASNQFGRTSWKCQATCKNFTKWRVLPDQVNLIPAGDSPREWGENTLELSRIRVMEARRDMVVVKASDSAVEFEQTRDSCGLVCNLKLF